MVGELLSVKELFVSIHVYADDQGGGGRPRDQDRWRAGGSKPSQPRRSSGGDHLDRDQQRDERDSLGGYGQRHSRGGEERDRREGGEEEVGRR